MFEPAGPQVAPPVVLDPTANGGFTQVAAGFLTFDPFVTEGLLLTFHVNATLLHGSAFSNSPSRFGGPAAIRVSSKNSAKCILTFAEARCKTLSRTFLSRQR